MTPKQQMFVIEYMKDLNATQAAIRAGCPERSAGSMAAEYMQKPAIAIALSAALAERAELAKIDAAWVLKRAAMLANFNIEDFIKVTSLGAVYDFSTATRDDWYCISELTVKSIRGRAGEQIPVDEVKLKSYDKLRALEMVGKHVDIQAFKDRVEHTGRLEVTGIERIVVDPKDTNS